MDILADDDGGGVDEEKEEREDDEDDVQELEEMDNEWRTVLGDSSSSGNLERGVAMIIL